MSEFTLLLFLNTKPKTLQIILLVPDGLTGKDNFCRCLAPLNPLSTLLDRKGQESTRGFLQKQELGQGSPQLSVIP